MMLPSDNASPQASPQAPSQASPQPAPPQPAPPQPPIPRWLRFVLTSDRAGSAWYIGLGFFFAPAVAAVSPWPALTTALWIVIALAGLWLGLLGIAMATGLAIVLKSGAEIPEDYWRSIFDYDSPSKDTASRATVVHLAAEAPV